MMRCWSRVGTFASRLLERVGVLQIILFRNHHSPVRFIHLFMPRISAGHSRSSMATTSSLAPAILRRLQAAACQPACPARCEQRLAPPLLARLLARSHTRCIVYIRTMIDSSLIHLENLRRKRVTLLTQHRGIRRGSVPEPASLGVARRARGLCRWLRGQA